jgi:xanthine dehydrogenase accessory factor
MLSGARPSEAVLVRGHKGAADWFVAPLARRTTPLYLYGAGHVGRALVRVLEGLPFDLVWVDTVRARFPAAIPAHARMEATRDPVSLAAQAPPGAFHLVMTYSHPLDLAICHALLRRGDFAYLGLIGSRTKRARFVKRLAEAGIDESMLARLVCPIGIPGLSGKEPPMIAVSTAADLVARLAAADKRAQAVAGS